MHSFSTETSTTDGATTSRPVCSCGWQGTQSPGYGLSSSPAYLAEYKAHLGSLSVDVPIVYDADVSCSNCGSTHSQEFYIGLSVHKEPCTICGVESLVPFNPVANAQREANRRSIWG